jgi:hypothetical protein
VGIPIDDEALAPTDDALVEQPGAAPGLSEDPEAPRADAAEQAAEVAPGWRVGRLGRDFETPEADAIDQAMEVPGGEPSRD